MHFLTGALGYVGGRNLAMSRFYDLLDNDYNPNNTQHNQLLEAQWRWNKDHILDAINEKHSTTKSHHHYDAAFKLIYEKLPEKYLKMFLNAFFKKFKKADIDFEWRSDVEKLSILSLILKSKDQELLDAQEKNFSLACRFREYITKRPDEEQKDADSKFQKFFS